MGLDVYFRRDIANALSAVAAAMADTVPASVLDVRDPVERARIVRAVYQTRWAVLVSVGLTVGLQPVQPRGDEIGPGMPLLWEECPRDG